MSVVLVILDGFGIGHDPARNALMAATMGNWDRLLDEFPHCELAASGEAVGLPAGQMGNSEVGHLTIGAGARVLQDLPRISAAIADGSFFQNPALTAACRDAVERDARVHLMGLVGPGGIHALDDHLVAMVELAHRAGLQPDRVLFHAFTDGRDTPPRSADRFLPALEARFDGHARVATVSGRYYAMDRDRRWERTERAYAAIAHADGRRAADTAAAVAAAYDRDESDEFILPTVLPAAAPMAGDDVAVHLNFRADRARQLTRALAQPHFSDFDRGSMPGAVATATLTEYQASDELPVAVAYPPVVVDSLAAHLSRLGKRQLHVAETEKYAHVTYFLNGGVEGAASGEDRILVPSRRDVATYDLAPQMSAEQITDVVIEAIERRSFDFIVVNYANPDMVGHTGNWDAAVRAAEFIDVCLGRLSRAAIGTDSPLVITADHGNIEQMRDADGEPQTMHTTSSVPFVVVDASRSGITLLNGELSDVAPTICELLGIPPGPDMTGHSLIRASR
ncbi:MAG: 2,3-bisphosphoglycerate-independent phosphoglycerate mutase [Chloroflexi bacterium]|nr:2,3-bisphosphoglycerate-independent phosphoglycerate mutase [Chloroflexota bacterium]